MTKKQIIYVSALINVILVSFLTGYIINSKNSDTSQNTTLTEQNKIPKK
jgi:hypothetical protein